MSGKQPNKSIGLESKSTAAKKSTSSTSGLAKKGSIEQPKRVLGVDNDKLNKIQSFNTQALSQINSTLNSHVRMMKNVVSGTSGSFKQSEQELRSVSTRLPKKKPSDPFTMTSSKFSQPSTAQDPFR